MSQITNIIRGDWDLWVQSCDEFVKDDRKTWLRHGKDMKETLEDWNNDEEAASYTIGSEDLH
jgi:hypothetical protein